MRTKTPKKISTIFITALLSLTFLFSPVYAAESVSYDYIFSDGSSDTWGSSVLTAISEEYALLSIDFASLCEEKTSSYEMIGVDASGIAPSELSLEQGTIIDIGNEYIFLVQLSSAAADIYSVTPEEMLAGELVYSDEDAVEIISAEEEYISLGSSIEDIGTALANADGYIVALTVSEDKAILVSAFYDDIAPYIGDYSTTVSGEEDETDTVLDLDLSALEELISEAGTIDTNDYSDTTDFELALAQAKSVYLSATSQDEIDEACSELQEAIDGLEENSDFSLNMTLIVAVIVIIGVIVLAVVLFLMMKKKNKGTTSGNKKTQKKTTDFNEIEYEDGYRQETKDPPPYDTAYRDVSPYKNPRYDEPARSDHNTEGQEQDDYYSNVYRNMLRPREDARSYTPQQNNDRYSDNGMSKNNSGYDPRRDNGYIHQERSDNDIYRENDNSRRDLSRQSPYSDDQYKNDVSFVAQSVSYDNEPPTSMLASAYLIRKKTGEKIPLSNNTFTLGRGNAHYRITDNPTVGRVHARISRDGVDYILEDLNSMNGTFLNGQKIQRNTPLMDRDSIKLADEEFEFRTGGMS